MRDAELYERLLGLEQPWSVEAVELRLAAGEVHIRVVRASAAPLSCPSCGKVAPGYDQRPRSWRHLDTFQYRTLIHAQVPRVDCPEHGVRQIAVPWAEANARVTALFERLIIDWLAAASLAAVAERLGLSWEQVFTIQRRAVRRGLARRGAEPVRHLGVDETSFQRRHEYVTVVNDLAGERVLYVADDRSRESLEGFFRGLSPAQLAGIEGLALDMWDPYLAAIRAHVPAAERKIVFDKFHILWHLNQAVDRTRRAEHKRLRAQGDERLTGTKYDWLRHPAGFSHKAWRAFGALRRSSLQVARAWALREAFCAIWRYRSPRWAVKFFRAWYFWATHSRLPALITVARLLKRRLANILTYLQLPLTNARSESVNAKIQWLKYNARGYRNRQNFRTAIYFHCGGLNLYPL
ncbi:MAG: ISL3 family transposase [Thermomicrobiales bacterium]